MCVYYSNVLYYSNVKIIKIIITTNFNICILYKHGYNAYILFNYMNVFK